MGLGSITHWTFDIVVISMLLAGIKEATGYELKVSRMAHTSDSQSFLRKYLHFGERLFSWCCLYAKNSRSFKLVTIPGANQLKEAASQARDAITEQ